MGGALYSKSGMVKIEAQSWPHCQKEYVADIGNQNSIRKYEKALFAVS